jgi:hypothetical protein
MRLELHWGLRPPSLHRFGRSIAHPLDFVRQRRTRGLQVDAGEHEVRRGEEVEALVTISSPEGLGDLEVGLVCTEYYDEESTDHEGDTSRATVVAIAHEDWRPVEEVTGVQNVRLAIPADAPFSYEGACLSFKWELVARGHKSRGLDAQAKRELSVLP